ncbi:MAG: flagellar export chaperone FliS [Pseudomonadota bacterium]
MFGSSNSGARAYAKVDIETGVVAASPHKLILMLFDGAMVAIASAIQHMNAGQIENKGKAISKAILIIDGGLRASLNKKDGGEIAENLDALYDFMGRHLLMANLRNQPKMLEEVYALLQEIKGAWETIGITADQTAAAANAPHMGKMPAYDALAPRPNSFVSA